MADVGAAGRLVGVGESIVGDGVMLGNVVVAPNEVYVLAILLRTVKPREVSSDVVAAGSARTSSLSECCRERCVRRFNAGESVENGGAECDRSSFGESTCSRNDEAPAESG
jgi:hypothetical protein